MTTRKVTSQQLATARKRWTLAFRVYRKLLEAELAQRGNMGRGRKRGQHEQQ